MEVSVNVNALEEYVTEKLPALLLNSTTDFAIAAFVMDVCVAGIDKIKEENV